jgi:hypothetical protein
MPATAIGFVVLMRMVALKMAMSFVPVFLIMMTMPMSLIVWILMSSPVPPYLSTLIAISTLYSAIKPVAWQRSFTAFLTIPVP